MSKIFLGMAVITGVLTAGAYGIYQYNLCSTCDGGCPITALFASGHSSTPEASSCWAKPSLSTSCCAPVASAPCCSRPCSACAVVCDGCPLCETDCSACCDAAMQAAAGGPALALKAARK